MTRPHSDRSQGRKQLYPGERLLAWHVRLTQAQRDKALAHGGAPWLRHFLDGLPDRPIRQNDAEERK